MFGQFAHVFSLKRMIVSNSTVPVTSNIDRIESILSYNVGNYKVKRLDKWTKYVSSPFTDVEGIIIASIC